MIVRMTNRRFCFYFNVNLGSYRSAGARMLVWTHVYGCNNAKGWNLPGRLRQNTMAMEIGFKVSFTRTLRDAALR